MKLHVVITKVGEYSDRREWPARAFTDEAAARAYLAEADAEVAVLKAWSCKRDGEPWHWHFNGTCDCGETPPRAVLDPRLEQAAADWMGVDDARRHIEVVELVGIDLLDACKAGILYAADVAEQHRRDTLQEPAKGDRAHDVRVGELDAFQMVRDALRERVDTMAQSALAEAARKKLAEATS